MFETVCVDVTESHSYTYSVFSHTAFSWPAIAFMLCFLFWVFFLFCFRNSKITFKTFSTVASRAKNSKFLGECVQFEEFKEDLLCFLT